MLVIFCLFISISLMRKSRFYNSLPENRTTQPIRRIFVIFPITEHTLGTCQVIFATCFVTMFEIILVAHLSKVYPLVIFGVINHFLQDCLQDTVSQFYLNTYTPYVGLYVEKNINKYAWGISCSLFFATSVSGISIRFSYTFVHTILREDKNDDEIMLNIRKYPFLFNR